MLELKLWLYFSFLLMYFQVQKSETTSNICDIINQSICASVEGIQLKEI